MWTAVHASAVWPQTPHPELCTTQGRPRRRSGALGCRTRVRAPGAARGGPRPAHPSRPRRPGTACSRAPRDLGCRGRAEGSRGIGKRASARGWPSAAPSPTPRRKSHLPRRAPEAAGGGGSQRGGGATGREEEGRRGAGAGRRRRGMLGPWGAPSPFLDASPPAPASRERATPPPSSCTRPAGRNSSGSPGGGERAPGGREPAGASVPARRKKRPAPSGCPPRPLPPGPAPSSPAPLAPGDRHCRRAGGFSSPANGSANRQGPG